MLSGKLWIGISRKLRALLPIAYIRLKMTEKTLCTVRTIDGVQFLFMPDGTKIPHVAMTRITQDCAEGAYPVAIAIVKMFVLIEGAALAGSLERHHDRPIG